VTQPSISPRTPLRSRLRRRVDRDTGMYHFHLELDPVTGSTVSSAYLAQLASVRERLAAMAMVELITGARAVDRRVPEVTVLIDLDTFMSGFARPLRV